MDARLKNRVGALVAGGAGAIALAGALSGWFEGDPKTAYADPAIGWALPTICYGHTRGVYRGQTATQAQCDQWQREDLAIANEGVDRVIEVPLSVGQRAALIDFTFNVGEAKLATSTMAAKFNAGDYAGGCAELNRWDKSRVNGVMVTLRGLAARREAETELCRS